MLSVFYPCVGSHYLTSYFCYTQGARGYKLQLELTRESAFNRDLGDILHGMNGPIISLELENVVHHSQIIES